MQKFLREERVTDYIMPVKLKRVSGKISNAETLLKQKLPQIGLIEPDAMLSEGAGHIILDFGRELSGGIRILTNRAEGNTKIRIRFGESLTETCAELIGKSEKATATNDHSLRDFETNLVFMSDMKFGDSGFRFVRIDFPEGGIFTIKNIYAAYQHRNLKRLGSFECSDNVINKIFDVSAYTVELCMQNRLWDGIKRDRLVWIGDTHPEMLSIVSLFGADKCIEEALEFARVEAPLPAFMNGIPAYSLWWLTIISDYYLHNANIEFLKKEKDYILALVKHFDSLLDKEGNIDFGNAFASFFLDWPTAESKEKKAGVYALFAYALEKTKLIFSALGEDTAILDAMLKRLNKSLDGGALKQLNAMRVLAGFVSPKDMVGKQLEGGAKGLSTFMSYYILSSIAKAGRTKDALIIMKDYYNAMLIRGATSFWEDFNMNWLEGSGSIDEFPAPGQKDIHGDYGAHCYIGFRHSLCHGWSSGPVPFLMHYILGVKALDVGCKSVSFKPNLCGLEYAKGTYPTPYGVIKVELKNIGGKTDAKITAPKEIKIIKET